MSEIDDALDFVEDNNTIGSGVSASAARIELASLRAAVAERDAAIERAVSDERDAVKVLCDLCARMVDYRNRNILNFQQEKADDYIYRIEIELEAIRARNETKEQA